MKFKMLTMAILLGSIAGCANKTSSTNQPTETNILATISPHYGNWCGADYPKDIYNAKEPIDQLDAACKIHDFCYQEQGYLDCGCDKALNQQLSQGLAKNSFGPLEKVFVQSFKSYFNASPCYGDNSAKVGISKALQNAAKNLSDKVKSIYRSMPFSTEREQESVKTDKQQEG